MEARQAAYLQRLGVDVWVRRRLQQAAPAAVEPAPLRESSEAPRAAPAPSARPISSKPMAKRDDSPSPKVAAATAFRIRCFRYGQVFVVLAEDAWPWRRLLLDAARAMNGFAVAERQDLVFDWPQPGGDPGGGARAFRAFLGHQTKNGERCLISGQRVLDILDTDADAIPAVEGRIYVVPGATNADAKKRLWQRIRNL